MYSPDQPNLIQHNFILGVGGGGKLPGRQKRESSTRCEGVSVVGVVGCGRESDLGMNLCLTSLLV